MRVDVFVFQKEIIFPICFFSYLLSCDVLECRCPKDYGRNKEAILIWGRCTSSYFSVGLLSKYRSSTLCDYQKTNPDQYYQEFRNFSEDPALSQYPARFDSRLLHGAVQSLHVGSSSLDFNTALKLMSENTPVLMHETNLIDDLIKSNWNFDNLCGDTQVQQNSAEHEVQVMCSDSKQHRFMECDLSKNIKEGPYFIREPETQILGLSLSSFVKCTREWTSRKLMLKAHIIEAVRQKLDEGTTNSSASKLSSSIIQPIKSGPLHCIAKEIHSKVNWGWLQEIIRFQGFGAILSAQLEAGVGGGLQPAKYSRRDEFMVQVAGCRRVLLVSPSFAFQGMYPYPCAHPYDKYSMVDLEKLDLNSWPAASQVQGMVAILKPGDILYIPEYWFVHAQEVKEENISLRIEVHRGNRAPSQAAAELRISRPLEERVMAAEGMNRVRYWLQLISTGREWKVLDLDTVQGYRRACMCQDIRDEIEQTLGPGKWAEFLSSVCSGRLQPTPWLNTNFREPLLITDKPLVFEDDRTEEEKKYPQLFRRKLESQGWKVD